MASERRLMTNDHCPACRLVGRAGFLRFGWRPRERHEKPKRILTCCNCGYRDDMIRPQQRGEIKLLTDQREEAKGCGRQKQLAPAE